MSWALLVLLALVTGWAIYASRGWLNEKDATTAIGDLYRAMTAERDRLAIDNRSLLQQLAQSKTLAAIAQKQRNDATAEKTKATVEKIKAATPKEAAKLINEVGKTAEVDESGKMAGSVISADGMMTELK